MWMKAMHEPTVADQYRPHRCPYQRWSVLPSLLQGSRVPAVGQSCRGIFEHDTSTRATPLARDWRTSNILAGVSAAR